jgi:predicted nucleic acid-binding protein
LIIYADTSALAKLIMDEDGTDEIRGVRATAEVVSSAAIAYVELRATVAAAIRANRFQPAERPLLVRSVEELWDSLSSVPVNDALLRRAGELAERMRLRAYDAVHLAALQQSGTARDVVFACWDMRLRAAAQSLGYALFPDA